jgi:hypothetical protein
LYLFLPNVLYREVVMPAALSPEARVPKGLELFRCSGNAFVKIAKELGVRIAQGPFSEVLNQKRSFDAGVGERLLEILDRMTNLQNAIGEAPIDWTQTDRVVNALTIRRIAQIAAESKDTRLDLAADTATKSVSTIKENEHGNVPGLN